LYRKGKGKGKGTMKRL